MAAIALTKAGWAMRQSAASSSLDNGERCGLTELVSSSGRNEGSDIENEQPLNPVATSPSKGMSDRNLLERAKSSPIPRLNLIIQIRRARWRPPPAINESSLTLKALNSSDFTRASDPLALFAQWFDEAQQSEPNDPEAMALASVDSEGLPDLRMVLCKGFDASGFVFYSNEQSAKGRQLAAAPRAALLFHWKTLRRQVRVRGAVSPASAAESDAYFASRGRDSRIGAWASEQSRPLESRAVLEKAFARYAAKFADADIPRPPYWRGFRVTPQEIEFWRDGANRLHDRVLFKRQADGRWAAQRLNP